MEIVPRKFRLFLSYRAVNVRMEYGIRRIMGEISQRKGEIFKRQKSVKEGVNVFSVQQNADAAFLCPVEKQRIAALRPDAV